MHSLWWLQHPEIITCSSVLVPLAHAIISILELAPTFIFVVEARQHHILMNIRIITKKQKYLVI